MEVTRLNFLDVLPELDEVLENATFLSIDGEFTGLNSGPDTSAFDTPAQYYAKVQSGSMNFLLVQFGLSAFTYDVQTDRYTQRSYNFYVFPTPLNRYAPDQRFMCQASSISFLMNQDFDFNKLFKYGIPYLNANDEEKLMKRLEEKQKLKEENADIIPISDTDRPKIEEICSRIEEFLVSDKEELTIDNCNGFIRRLVYQEARIRWPKKVRIETKVEQTYHCLSIQKVGTNEEEKEKDNQKYAKEELEIKQAVGFSIVLKKIVKSGKIIVGHNMLLDVCHMVDQFFIDLPNDYSEFKSLLHGLFPSILDTKVICQSQQFKEYVSSSNLSALLDTVSKPPFSLPDVQSIEGRNYSTGIEKLHEAGYDAYITGLCFIALSNYLGVLNKSENATVLANSPLLNPFLNKLLMRKLKDIPYINLVGKDPVPNREHVFHVTFPKEWKYTDINLLFHPFGDVYISWLSNTSAFVSLYHREYAGAVIKTLSNHTVCKVQKYSQYQANLLAETSAEKRKRKLLSPNKNTDDEELGTNPNGAEASIEEKDGWKVATNKKRKKRNVQEASGTATKKAFEENNTWK